jgi:hypothetical protein
MAGAGNLGLGIGPVVKWVENLGAWGPRIIMPGSALCRFNNFPNYLSVKVESIQISACTLGDSQAYQIFMAGVDVPNLGVFFSFRTQWFGVMQGLYNADKGTIKLGAMIIAYYNE